MKKIILRHLADKDIPCIQEWMRDPEINHGFKFDISEKSKEESIRAFNHQSMEGDQRHYAIADAETDAYYGTISLKNINNQDHSGESAIVTIRAVHRSGIASSAFTQLIEIANNELNLKKIYAYVYTDNICSLNFHKKMGMKEIPEKKDFILVDGKLKERAFFLLSME